MYLNIYYAIVINFICLELLLYFIIKYKLSQVKAVFKLTRDFIDGFESLSTLQSML